MFTQNVMQAFRSVFVALLIISVLARWCAAQENKVDASVLAALQTRSTVSVAISLQDKPPSKQISDVVKADFESDIEAKAAEIRARIRPFHQRNQALPPNVKAEVRMMHENLDRMTGQMRREIGRRLKNYVAPSQQRVRTAIENAGDTVYAQVAIQNVMGAQLSATGVTLIAALDDVERIELDPVIEPDLAGSAPIIYAPRFWEAGYDGGVYDVGIVEQSGVEDEHPRLRSKAAGKLIERQPGIAEPDPELPEPNHGTWVAGVVAMRPYRDIEGEHKGIAHGLDTILDATYTYTQAQDTGAKKGKLTGAARAMEWAMTYTSDDADDVEDPSDDADDPSADVITYAFSAEIGGDGKMDHGDEDYTDYAMAFDALIDANNVLIIKSAGNESKSDTDRYTLGWGSDSYNAIVVGASTASYDDKPRAKNKVAYFSGRGPTPEGRKKPDVVAPGKDIMTTNRDGGYTSFSGTSAAVPHVAGAILLFADHGLSDPMMQKALLINSAEDRGPAGWDKDWGWGYIDLYTALEQYDYTISDSIESGASDDDGSSDDDGASDDGRGVRWYKGTMTGCQTATLVWHRRPGEPLANLDMYLYNETRTVLYAYSNSLEDNVEQVKMPQGKNGRVSLLIVNNTYDPDDDNSEDDYSEDDYLERTYFEKFGLALPSKFRLIESESAQP